MSPPLLSLRGISKRFGAVEALVDVDLDVAPGEIHAVLGENGAGKSTLMRVVYGLVTPGAGTIAWRSRPVRFASPREARRAGVGMVHQEFTLVDALSVLENLALSLCPNERWWMRRAAIAAEARRLAGELGLELGDLDVPVGELPVGRRQAVEIVKALAGQTALLILDEPTAVLTPNEVAQLFSVLDRLRRAGTAVLFITHKLPEVKAIADRITVMRRGRVVTRVRADDLGEAELAELMVGGLAQADIPAPRLPTEAAPVLELVGVSACNDRGVPMLRDVTFSVRGGEVFGIAGVDGNGQAELFEVLAGVRSPRHGTVVITGARVRDFAPAAMAAAGVGCVPPDRLRHGVVPAMSVRENAVLNAVLVRRISPGVLTRPSAERSFARQLVDRYGIRTGSLEAPVRTLSGGNIQKLVVGRALALEPQVLIAASPTRGLDVGASQAVHSAFGAALSRGAGVLLISTDLDEILARADRLAVLYRGRLSRVFERPFPAVEIGGLMAGSEAT